VGAVHDHVALGVPEGQLGGFAQLGDRLLRVEVGLVGLPREADDDVAVGAVDRHVAVENVLLVEARLNDRPGAFKFIGRGHAVQPHRLVYRVDAAADVDAEAHVARAGNVQLVLVHLDVNAEERDIGNQQRQCQHDEKRTLVDFHPHTSTRPLARTNCVKPCSEPPPSETHGEYYTTSARVSP